MKRYYNKTAICGGIVLYNPDLEVLDKNINSLIGQLDCLVLVDNGSKHIEAVKAKYQNYDHIVWISNEKNEGIAYALNEIMHFAIEHHYEWFLTMDQDSRCDEHLIEKYFRYAMNLDEIGVFSPFVLNNSKITFAEYQNKVLPNVEKVKDPIDCITSASLVRTKAAEAIGGYNNQLFIDCVDVDFNIRMMETSYKIVRINKAYMFQAMGDGKKVWWISLLYKLTKKDQLKHLTVTPVYGNKRLYYMSRNSACVQKRYGEKAGKRMTKKWMRAQFVYYMLTYPTSRSRKEMRQSIKDGYRDFELHYKEIMNVK